MWRANCWCGLRPVAILILSLSSGCGEAPKADAPSRHPPITTNIPSPPRNIISPNSEISSAKNTSQKPSDTALGTESTSKSSDANSPAEDLSTLTRQELLIRIAETQQEGTRKIAQKQGEEGYRIFVDSGHYAEQLLHRFPSLTSQERMSCSNAFYNYACGLSMLSDPTAAAAVIKQAIATGYDDFENLDKDTDLAPLRQLPDYAHLREEWEKSAAVLSQARMATELAEFESYPFDFTLPDLDEKPVTLADFAGKIVIADIWGTWCPPCRAEVPSFVKLQSKYGELGLQIVGLNYERGNDRDTVVKGIRSFAESNNMNYPCLIGNEATRAQVPSFLGYPTTLFLDRTGKVRLQFVGAHSYGKLESVVIALLAENGK